MKGDISQGAMEDLRIKSVRRNRKITLRVNGRPIEAYEGETVHAALMAAGIRILKKSKTGMGRGFFCGMGLCYDCLVTINGAPNQRACMTEVEDHMEILLDEA